RCVIRSCSRMILRCRRLPNHRRPAVLRQTVRRGESTVVTTLERAATATGDAHAKAWRETRRVLVDGESHTTDASRPEPLSARLQHSVQAVRDAMAAAFLPRGFPNSVTPDYLPYSAWQFVHSVSGTITGTLSTQALLHALGLGAAASAGIAATTNWIVKDGFGLLGGVLFAGAPRRYRLLAALAIQASTLAEMLTPLVPHLFLPMASLSNVGKNVGWLAASAARAPQHRAFAHNDNLGDVTGKAAAQATLAGLVGTVAGVACSLSVGNPHPAALLALFAPLCAVNIWSCYRANLAAPTLSLNVERAELATADALRAIVAVADARAPSDPTYDAAAAVTALIQTPAQVAAHESLLAPYASVLGPPPRTPPLDLEPPLTASLLARIDAAGALDALLRPPPPLQQQQDWRYRVVAVDFDDAGGTGSRRRVCVWFLPGAAAHDRLRAFFHATLVRLILAQPAPPIAAAAAEAAEARAPSQDTTSAAAAATAAVRRAAALADEWAPTLEAALLAHGWQLDAVHLAPRGAAVEVLDTTASTAAAADTDASSHGGSLHRREP
ncbi:hypothetical protein HK405_005564, partial [Cladochytrium tenue]